MKLLRIMTIVFAFAFTSLLTGCYTQVATSDSTTAYETENQSYSDNYYSDDQEVPDSDYYAETDSEDVNNETTIINKYYFGYPYNRYYYDYYPSITFGITVGWGYWGYYPYWAWYPYYQPYYGGWCGYGWYDPYYYCCYPGYYYYTPYYYPYYGNGYYSYHHGYKYRNDNVSRLRNNSGGRNYGTRTRDPLNPVTINSTDRNRDGLNRGRDLQVSSNDANTRNLGIRDKGRNLTRDNVNVDKVTRNEIKSVDRNSERNRQLGLSSRNSDRKNLGREDRNNNVKQLGIRDRKPETGNINNRKNLDINVRRENTTRKPNSEPRVNKTPERKNNNPRTYSPPKGNNNPPRTYTPPKRNDNPPRTYSPPRTNNNPPRSYNPPRNSTPPRTNSSPRSSGGNNGGRRR